MKRLLLLITICISSISFGQTKKDIIGQQTKTIDSLNLESSKLTNLNSDISNELAEAKKEMKKLEESNSSNELLISSSAEEISILKDQIVSKDELIVKLENEIASKDKEIAELKKSTITDNAEIATLEDPNEISSGNSLSSNSSSVNSVKIGNLEVMAEDDGREYSLIEAINFCEALGEGWRLPTKDEWNILYENHSKLEPNGWLWDYWTSSIDDNESPWYFNSQKGTAHIGDLWLDTHQVRAVRDL
jgi:hypothetical protein